MDLYLLCLIVGGGLFLLSLLGGHDHGVGDHGAGLEHGVDHAADHGAELHTSDIASWFTLRALISFVAFFGLAGVLGGLAGVGSTPKFLMALITGLVVGAFTSYAFRLARSRGEVTSAAGRLTGRTGTVIVPPAPNREGKVAVTVTGQIEQFAATSPDTLKPGDPVLVIGETRGVLDVKYWDGR